VVKSFSFIVLTHFFQFNELKFLKQPGYLLFKLNHQYFFTVNEILLLYNNINKTKIKDPIHQLKSSLKQKLGYSLMFVTDGRTVK